jgi:predicted SAM-dependent methyltransferase
MKLLNIGCGHNYHPDWINLDLYNSKFVKYHDIKKSLPFAGETIDAVYHSHVLEHITKAEGKKFITDCYRVLKPGGILRVVVPDLEQICLEYLSNLEKGFNQQDAKAILNYQWNKIELFDQIVRQRSGGEMLSVIRQGHFNKDYVLFRNGEELKPLLDEKSLGANSERSFSLIWFKKMVANFLKRNDRLVLLKRFIISLVKKADPQKSGEAHRWLYDKLDLKILLESTGFRNFKITTYNESQISNWTDYNLDKAAGGDYPRKPDSLFAEVIK